MIDKKTLAKLDTKEPLSRYLEEAIINEGIKTGSKVFGGFSLDTSDVDWILPPWFNIGRYSSFFVYNKVEYASVIFQSYYVKTRYDGIWNLLTPHDMYEYEVWVGATFALRKLRMSDEVIATALESKVKRVYLFEALRCVLGKNYTPASYGQVEKNCELELFVPNDDDIPF